MNNGMPAIWESPDQLRTLMAQATHPRKLQRLQMLYLLRTGQAQTRTHVAQLLGLYRETVGDWLESYRRGAVAGLLSWRTPPGLSSSLSPEAVAGLREHLADPAGAASYKELQHWLETTYGLKTTYRIVYYTATRVLGARLAVARPCHIKKPGG